MKGHSLEKPPTQTEKLVSSLSQERPLRVVVRSSRRPVGRCEAESGTSASNAVQAYAEHCQMHCEDQPTQNRLNGKRERERERWGEKKALEILLLAEHVQAHFVRRRDSALNFSLHKLCLIFQDRFLIRFPPKFQERLLLFTASPEFVFWGPKKNSFV